MSTEEPLIQMANQIGTFFETQGDPKRAAQDIASHIKLFWAPSMRASLLRLVDEAHAEAMLPIVLTAVQTHREQLVQPDAKVPGAYRVKGPEGGGDAG